MKRIVLGISVLLMLVQNGFALTDAEYDKQIANETDTTIKQMYRCNKVKNKPKIANVQICLKAVDMLKKDYPNAKQAIYSALLNTGLIYDYHNDKLNGYKYYMKAAKLGSIQAQKNLNIMCKESPWACK